jgi:hypothetical protein
MLTNMCSAVLQVLCEQYSALAGQSEGFRSDPTLQARVRVRLRLRLRLRLRVGVRVRVRVRIRVRFGFGLGLGLGLGLGAERGLPLRFDAVG